MKDFYTDIAFILMAVACFAAGFMFCVYIHKTAEWTKTKISFPEGSDRSVIVNHPKWATVEPVSKGAIIVPLAEAAEESTP